jgi:hypothetical protein
MHRPPQIFKNILAKIVERLLKIEEENFELILSSVNVDVEKADKISPVIRKH